VYLSNKQTYQRIKCGGSSLAGGKDRNGKPAGVVFTSLAGGGDLPEEESLLWGGGGGEKSNH